MAKKLKINQNDLKDFFKNHVEKIIMAVAAVVLGLLLWNALSLKPGTSRTPTELKNLAAASKSYLNEDTWPKMAEYRQADTTAPERIKAAATNVSTVNSYNVGVLAGPLVKAAELRLDPVLLPATELIARPATIKVLKKRGENRGAGDREFVSPLRLKEEELKRQKEREEEEKNKNKNKDKDKENKDKDKDKEKEKVPPKNAGDSFEKFHGLEIFGVRGERVQNMIPTVLDVVTVVGIAPIENQWKLHDAALRGRRGYYPDRDRPTYLYLQVARQVEGEEWDENYFTQIENAEENIFQPVAAPEVVDPKYYDPVLTRPFPPVVLFDYRQYATHPKTPVRRLVPSFLWLRETGDKRVALTGDLVREQLKKGEGNKDKTTQSETDEKFDPKKDELERLKGSSRLAYDEAVASLTPQAPFRLVRFVDYDPPKDKRVRYKVRLWLLDPNDPPDNLEYLAKNSDREKPNVGLGAEGGSEGNRQATKASYRKEPVTAQMIDATVAERLRRKIEDYVDLPADYLVKAVPTAWSTETEFVDVSEQSPADVYVGTVREASTVPIGNTRVPKDEPTAVVLASVTARDLGTAVPATKQVRGGDLLNFVVKSTRVLDPATLNVVELRQVNVKSNMLVVDLQGGSEVPLNEIREVKTYTENPNTPEGFETLQTKFTDPGEVLVMDAEGKFKIRNTTTDYRKFRSMLFLPDETAEYGKPPAKEADDKNKRKGPGSGGPGDGGGGGGMG